MSGRMVSEDDSLVAGVFDMISDESDKWGGTGKALVAYVEKWLL